MEDEGDAKEAKFPSEETEKVEVRAFGCLVEEMLELLKQNLPRKTDEACISVASVACIPSHNNDVAAFILSAEATLLTACMQVDVLARPSFKQIVNIIAQL